MKICVVVINSVWYDPRVRKQIDEYINNGNEVYVVGLEDRSYQREEVEKIPGNVNIVPYDKNDRRKFNSFIKKLLREKKYSHKIAEAIVKTHADVIHANDLNALVPAYTAARKLKCKLIYDSHEVFIENISVYSSRVKRAYWGFYEKKIIKKVNLLVCVSHAASRYFAEKYSIDNFMVVTNCYKKVDGSITEMPKNPGFEVLNHGKFYDGRGYKTMLEAAKITENNQIIYVLRGMGELEDDLKKYLEEEHLKNAKIEPPVKVYEMVRKAAASHVGVAITEPICLNFKLSVSNKIFEYAAAGLPVIMSDIPEHRYLNEKYNFGIVLRENTPQCLSDAVMRLYSDRELYENLRENAIKMSVELNWENEFKKLMNFEKQLIGENNA